MQLAGERAARLHRDMNVYINCYWRNAGAPPPQLQGRVLCSDKAGE